MYRYWKGNARVVHTGSVFYIFDIDTCPCMMYYMQVMAGINHEEIIIERRSDEKKKYLLSASPDFLI